MTKTSTRLATNGTRTAAAAGAAPIDRWAEKKAEPNFTDDTGREHWTRQFRFPATDINKLAPYLKKSTDNLLPGSNPLDAYAPCIHSCRIADAEDGATVAVCDYQRPDRSLILRPGRAMLSTETYSTMVKEEIGEFIDSRDEQRQYALATGAVAATQYGSWNVRLRKRWQQAVEDRSVIVVECADPVENELNLYARKEDWIGKGGQFTIGKVRELTINRPAAWYGALPTTKIGGLRFANLKLVAAEIHRRDSDLSIIDSTWKFAQNPSGWTLAGVIRKTYYCTDMEGNILIYNENTQTAADARGRNVLSFMVIPLEKREPEIIKGTADFSPMKEYFAWMF